MNPQGKKSNIQNPYGNSFLSEIYFVRAVWREFLFHFDRKPVIIHQMYNKKIIVPKEIGNDEMKYYSTFAGSVKVMLRCGCEYCPFCLLLVVIGFGFYCQYFSPTDKHFL